MQIEKMANVAADRILKETVKDARLLALEDYARHVIKLAFYRGMTAAYSDIDHNTPRNELTTRQAS